MQAPQSIAIVVPVFNDWPSFDVLLGELCSLAPSLPCNVTVFAVDDGSTVPSDLAVSPTSCLAVTLISLHCNLGHQRAISVGISECVRRGVYSHILVMDGDGEDAPSDITKLLNAQATNPDAIAVIPRNPGHL